MHVGVDRDELIESGFGRLTVSEPLDRGGEQARNAVEVQAPAKEPGTPMLLAKV